MPKVIETNLSLQVNNQIIDHQSRIIEVDSWDEYVTEIKEGKAVNYYNATMQGYTLPRECKIENFKANDFHLSCDVLAGTWKTKKLAYLINKMI